MIPDPTEIPDSTRFADQQPRLFGIDFTSAPSHQKSIMVAAGRLSRDRDVESGSRVLRVDSIESLSDFEQFERWLNVPGPWLGGFDLPFGLPRELVEHFGWPTEWAACIRAYAAQTRADLRDQFRGFCDAREPGNKFAHRATDKPAGSSPSMKWVNPPVAWMLHAGAVRLLDAGVSIPGVLTGDPQRIALEAYPGLLARSVTRASYKSDSRAKQTEARRTAREQIVRAIEAGRSQPGIQTRISESIRLDMLADGSGDRLDAVLCLVQAAWALSQTDRRFGLPLLFDPLEGWIVGAPPSIG